MTFFLCLSPIKVCEFIQSTLTVCQVVEVSSKSVTFWWLPRGPGFESGLWRKRSGQNIAKSREGHQPSFPLTYIHTACDYSKYWMGAQSCPTLNQWPFATSASMFVSDNKVKTQRRDKERFESRISHSTINKSSLFSIKARNLSILFKCIRFNLLQPKFPHGGIFIKKYTYNIIIMTQTLFDLLGAKMRDLVPAVPILEPKLLLRLLHPMVLYLSSVII